MYDGAIDFAVRILKGLLVLFKIVCVGSLLLLISSLIITIFPHDESTVQNINSLFINDGYINIGLILAFIGFIVTCYYFGDE